MGTRHRAALGVCEETAAVVIIVSEETGRISVCTEGKFKSDLSRDELEKELRELYERGSLAMRTKRFFSPPTMPSMPAAGGGGSNGNPGQPSGSKDDEPGSAPQEKSK